jgi:hypothetical protein
VTFVLKLCNISDRSVIPECVLIIMLIIWLSFQVLGLPFIVPVSSPLESLLTLYFTSVICMLKIPLLLLMISAILNLSSGKCFFFPSRLIQLCESFKSHHHTNSICAFLALSWSSLFHLISSIIWFYLHTYCQALKTNYHYYCFCIMSSCIPPPNYLPTHLSICLSTHIPTYLPNYLLIYLPTYLYTYSCIHPPFIHPRTHPSTYRPNHSLTYLPIQPPTYLPTYLLPTHLPI